MSDPNPIPLLGSLLKAVNDHDLDGIVACFTPDYRNETPAHPTRGFTGQDQVRRNWQQILAAVRDLHAEVLGYAEDGPRVWSEWEHRGTRPDGSRHLMRGVVVFEVRDDRAAAARFYLEPVDDDGGHVDEAVRRQVRPVTTP
jgi:ketosteroid isomerase-like protein